MRILVVVPTYNEALNLPHLIPRVLDAVPQVQIMVVDDGSPDGTASVAQLLGEQHGGRVRVIERATKSGRGGAVLAGLTAGLDENYDAYVEMDADLSHQPEELPALLAAAGTGLDLVVGSRYLPGSRIDGWSWRRRVFSRMANMLIRPVIGVPLSDFTNGFRVYSPRSVQYLASTPLRETGYISLSEWAYALHGAGLRIGEVPTVFINRQLGTSNTSAGEAANALRGLLRLKRRRYPPRVDAR